MKIFPRKGNIVHVNYVTDYLVPQEFKGICTNTHWANKATTFTVFNTKMGFKQKFFFFSPLVCNVISIKKKIKKK